MTDQIVFDPDALDRYARAADDALADIARAQRAHDDVIEQVRASGSPPLGAGGWVGFDGTLVERHALERLGEFTAWLARRARQLDDDAGLARLDTLDLLGPGVVRLWDADMLYTRGTQVAGFLSGSITGGLSAAGLAMLQLYAGDPDFARGLVRNLGGTTDLVDLYLRHHHLLAPSNAPGETTTGTHATERLRRLTVGLGTALGQATLDPGWTQASTDDLVTMLHRQPGHHEWVPGQAAALAVLLAAAPRASTRVVATLLAHAVEIDRTQGGPAAWSTRATTTDTGLTQPLLDHTGAPAHDPVSSLLAAAAQNPTAALDALSTGGTLPHVGADGVERRVDATLSHLLDGHDFDSTGWTRVGAVLHAAVVPNVGVGALGRSAATVSGQAVALLGDRVRTKGALPRPLHRPTASLLTVSMPAVVPAVTGTDVTGWARHPTDWTLQPPPIYPAGLATQPVLHTADLATVLDRLGSNPDQVHRLTAAAVATVDLAAAGSATTARGDLDAVAATAGVSADAAGTILTHAYEGVVADHAANEATRAAVGTVGGILSTIPVMGVAGSGISLIADHLIHEYAVPEDYHDVRPALAGLVEQRAVDALLVNGYFDVDAIASEAVLVVDGHLTGFDRTSTAYLEWKTTSGDYPTALATHLTGQVGAPDPAGSGS